MDTNNIRKINIEEINVTIKILKNFEKRFPSGFYKIYSHNKFFNESNIYKVITKNNKKKIYNIIIVKDIYILTKDEIIEILENYTDKDIIFVDNYGIEHGMFYDVFGVSDLYFNWNNNKFLYKNRKFGLHLLNNHEKIKLVYYLENKEPFVSTPQINTPLYLLKESSYFPT